MSEGATAVTGAQNPLPEAAVAFLSDFHKWALTLTLDDFKEIAPILQTLKAAHVQEHHVSRQT